MCQCVVGLKRERKRRDKVCKRANTRKYVLDGRFAEQAGQLVVTHDLEVDVLVTGTLHEVSMVTYLALVALIL